MPQGGSYSFDGVFAPGSQEEVFEDRRVSAFSSVGFRVLGGSLGFRLFRANLGGSVVHNPKP